MTKWLQEWVCCQSVSLWQMNLWLSLMSNPRKLCLEYGCWNMVWRLLILEMMATVSYYTCVLRESGWCYLRKLDESTARRQLKSPQSLSGRSIHLTLVTKWSWSWPWMTHCHLLCAMSIGPPILRYSYFKIWPWKSMVKVMCVVKAQGHI